MSSTTAPSLARARSLRVPPTNAVKTTPTTPPLPSPGPSNITLFLTNLRLLDLDLRNDWPDINAVTFSTKGAQENQKKRIQCVEWALYHLFVFWDPEEARNKLQPFFPPLEPLQSLNLRAALFRCLDQAKKNGVLGRDTVLRKTMLDECKGDRLDEVLAVFSNAVLKKVLQDGGDHAALAQQLALENFSYTGGRSVLSALIVTHKASLSKLLREKVEAMAKYQDFSELLKLNDRRLARRHEQLKQAIEESHTEGRISERETRDIQDKAYAHWSGNSEWLQSILFGDSRSNGDGLLVTRFDKVWNHVEEGSIGDIEGTNQSGLLDQLNARVKDQESRLARWQDFGKTLSKGSELSPPKEPPLGERKNIDLGFTYHQNLQIGRSSTEKKMQAKSSISLDEYTRHVENMRSELAEVGKPQTRVRPPRQSLVPDARVLSPSPMPPDDPPPNDEEWASASDSEQLSPASVDYSKSTSHTPPSEAALVAQEKVVVEPLLKSEKISALEFRKPAPRKDQSPPPKATPRNLPPIETGTETKVESDLDLADQILNSVSAASPSPKKSRHTLSLAERTRLSMSRASHSQFSDLNDEHDIAELPRLAIRSRPSMARAPSSETVPGLHEDLIERTRKSMAGFEAAQKKAQLDRRRSVKDAKKRSRESSYFPKVEEEEVATPDASAIELMEGDPDYESVFKSRPKIKTSPAVSPTRIWEEDEE